MQLHPVIPDEDMAMGRHGATFSVRSTLRKNSNHFQNTIPGANA